MTATPFDALHGRTAEFAPVLARGNALLIRPDGSYESDVYVRRGFARKQMLINTPEAIRRLKPRLRGRSTPIFILTYNSGRRRGVEEILKRFGAQVRT